MGKDSYITVKVKTTNLELTPALKEFVTKKLHSLEKFLKYYQNKSKNLLFEVEIGRKTNHHKNGDVYRAEINFTAGGIHLRSEAVHEDIYSAIDETKDDLQRKMREYSKKDVHLFRRAETKIKNLLKGLR